MAEPDNPILREIREFRREHLASQEAVALSLGHLKSFADSLNRLSDEFEGFRVETRTALREIRADILSSDNNALNRHNDLLRTMERLRAIEEREQRIEEGLALFESAVKGQTSR